jgi:serine/threonine protein kinase
MEPLAEGDPGQVGAYRLQARLGAGGMGRVFLGRSPAGRAVAVKVVHPELARDPEFRARFRREVGAAQAVRLLGMWRPSRRPARYEQLTGRRGQSLAGCCDECRSATVELVRSGSGVMESSRVASGLGALEGATGHAGNNDWRPGS